MFKFIVVFVYLQFNICSSDELKMVIEVFRHGARARLFSDFKQNNDDYDVGELTAVGMRQLFNLGSIIRQKYILDQNFLSYNYNPKELYVRSTDVNRTIVSAYSQLMGIYPYSQNELFQIPIHTVDQGDDYLLRSFDVGTCPSNILVEKRFNMSKEYKELSQIFQSTLDKTSEVMNHPVSLYEAAHVFDTYQANKFQRKSIDPRLVELEKNLSFIYNATLYLSHFHELDQIRFTNTPLFNFILKNFQMKISNETELKMIMLSAHDTTLGQVMAGLNISNYQCVFNAFFNQKQCNSYFPQFASNIFFELYQSQVGQFYVQTVLNGTAQDICGDLKCPFENFTQKLTSIVIDDFDIKCGKKMKVLPDIQIFQQIDITDICVMLLTETILYFILLKGYRYIKKQKVDKELKKFQNTDFQHLYEDNQHDL